MRSDLIDVFINSREFKQKHCGVHRLAGFRGSDLAILSRYVPATLETEEGFLTDWLGIKHCLADLPFLAKTLSGRSFAGVPVPDDGFHAEAIEYLALFAALETAGESFTMMELGAGWAPWLCAGGVVAKRLGKKPIRLIGVEGEGNKLPLIRRHLNKNGLCPTVNFGLTTESDGVAVTLYHGVVNDGTSVKIPVVGIEDYGASLVSDSPFKGNDIEEVQGYHMAQLAENVSIFDLVHIDIQGYEQELIKAQVKVFVDKVKWLAIGTHSREIESFLIDFLPEHGFRLFRETPCNFSFTQKPEHMVDATNVDGFQIWVNDVLVKDNPF